MLKHRLPSTIFLVACLLLVFLTEGVIGRMLFVCAGTLLVFAAVNEYLGLISAKDRPVLKKTTAVVSALMFLSATVTSGLADAVGFLVFSLACVGVFFWFCVLIARGDPGKIESVLSSLSAVLFVTLPLCLCVPIYHGEGRGFGPSSLFFLIAVTKSGDIGAYVTGTLSAKIMPAGNHKIFPEISPKKSWEGTIGGLASSIGASIALAAETGLVEDNSMVLPVIVGAALFTGGFLGDLAESSLKRASAVKDSGSVVPGMGGVLDVLDSLLINIPLFYGIILILGS